MTIIRIPDVYKCEGHIVDRLRGSKWSEGAMAGAL